MIVFMTYRRWNSKPCPHCGKRVKKGLPECPNCEAQLHWEGRSVALAESGIRSADA